MEKRHKEGKVELGKMEIVVESEISHPIPSTGRVKVNI